MINIYRISGGWLLVSNVVSQGSSPTQLPVKTSYRGVSSKEMVLTKSALKELRNHLHFTRIRFYCKKRGGRTFHISTAANSTGEAAVKYLSGETDVMPASCGSFVIMSDDNSRLARVCKDWGYQRFLQSWQMGRRERSEQIIRPPCFCRGSLPLASWTIWQVGMRRSYCGSVPWRFLESLCAIGSHHNGSLPQGLIVVLFLRTLNA